MPERKVWSPEEDDILKYLRDEAKINKWSLIAKKMSQEYKMPDRTGKQCRQRYHNHLDSTILRIQWNPQQETYLYKLHDQIGNKWAIIAQKLVGRTDNCVKNHFYSKMRKAIRKLNKVIHTNFKKQIKQIKLNVLYKLVEATDEKFKINPSIDEQISDRCCQLKNELLIYASQDQQQEDTVYLEELAKAIHEVSSKYRKKPKRSRRHSAHAPDIVTLGKISPKYRMANSDNQCQSQENQHDNDLQNSLYLQDRGEQHLDDLQSVKQQQEQPKDIQTICKTVPTSSSNGQVCKMQMKLQEYLLQGADNDKQMFDRMNRIDYLQIQQQQQGDKQCEQYRIQEQDVDRDSAQDMLSQQIQKMNINCNLCYDDIEIDDKDQIF